MFQSREPGGPAKLLHSGSCAVFTNTTDALLRRDPQQQENAYIAARLRARDPQILDELVVRYQHRLMRHLLYLTGDRELAEDLFQETWMRVVLRGAQFKGDSQFVTWLFSIARNLVLDLRRRIPRTASFEALTESGDERALDLRATDQNAFDHCLALESDRIVSEAFSALTLPQREVILLRFREEMPLTQIAAITRAPLSTVKARLYRGLVVLRQRLSDVMRSRATRRPA